jgi:hypothetical protein
MPSNWSYAAPRMPTDRETFQATLIALIDSAWARVAVKDVVHFALKSEDAPQAVRRGWAHTAFRRVIAQLPTDSPYRAALQDFLDTQVDELISLETPGSLVS